MPRGEAIKTKEEETAALELKELRNYASQTRQEWGHSQRFLYRLRLMFSLFLVYAHT